MGAHCAGHCAANSSGDGEVSVTAERTVESEATEVNGPLGFSPLRVTIVSARDLRNADWWGMGAPDPYCICEIAGKPLSRTLTKAIKNNRSPVWDHEAEFADYEAGDALSFYVWDEDLWKRDDLLGVTSLQNSQFHPRGFEGELRLSQTGKQPAYLTVTVDKVTFAETDRTPRTPSASKRAKASGNANSPRDYLWLEGPLQSLSNNTAATLGCTEAATGKCFTPVFFMIGGCPNSMCGPQAIMFCADEKGQLDFWWVKPTKGDGTKLETETLSLHAQGPHKNSPGLSRACYEPVAALFQEGGLVRGWRLGLEQLAPDRGGVRAFLQEEDSASGAGERFYVHLFWQETWSSNPFSRSKYILGKIVYQKELGGTEYFSRQYGITDGAPHIADFEEPAGSSVLPSLGVKSLWDLGS
mmetsp:Transcript_48212/g.153901  ORF Transcript_48212/g.153901 Transcript_48212/m.153901 type:complete len:413 (+) Transcript_48212:103-1341(+)